MNDLQNIQYEPSKITNLQDIVSSRQAQEVQAAMIVAKRFPRNETESWGRIMNACKRVRLAENAVFEYQRGGETINGPSIRLAETIAQAWGNIDFGYIELEQKSGESQVMAYCWDLETNVRQSKIFSVPHIRQTKKGAYPLTDPRDIYEHVANNAARRVRACILGIIPKDIVDDALSECRKTLETRKEPLIDRVRKMLDFFYTNFGVPQNSIEKYIGTKAELFTEANLKKLRGIYMSINEGRIDREDVFELSTPDPEPILDEKKEQQKNDPVKEENPNLKEVKLSDI